MSDEGERHREPPVSGVRDGAFAEPGDPRDAAGRADEMEGTRMNGVGPRDGYGSPPWEPAPPADGPQPDGRDAPLADALQAGTARAETARADTVQAETVRADTVRADTVQADTVQADTVCADAVHADTVQVDTIQVDTVHSGSVQADATRADASAGSSVTPGASPSGQAPPDDAEAGGTGPGASGRQGEEPPSSPGGKRPRRRRSFWRELPVLIVVALVLALIIKTYAIQAFYIPSGSMQNTLEIGDRVLVNKLVYDFRDIHRGDIVVFDGAGSWDPATPQPSSNPFARFFGNLGEMIGIAHGEDDYIKRVIGLPGDHVACCNAQGQVTVNGVALSEQSYLYPGNSPSEMRFNITVPPGRLWVMGDHRAVSYDSREHMGDPGGGTIPESAVLGRAFVIIWPPSRWRFLPIPSTFEQPKLNASNQPADASSALVAELGKGTVPVKPEGPGLPLVFGFAGAVPVTLLQRGVRRRLGDRRAGRRGGQR